MKLILLRHGECITNTAKYIKGQYDYNFLTIKGLKQAELAALELVDRNVNFFDHVYTSSVLRAMQTANLVLQTMDLHGTTFCKKFDEFEEWWDGSSIPLNEYKQTHLMEY